MNLMVVNLSIPINLDVNYEQPQLMTTQICFSFLFFAKCTRQNLIALIGAQYLYSTFTNN